MRKIDANQITEIDTVALAKNFQSICEYVASGINVVEEFFENEKIQTALEYAEVLDDAAEECLKIYGAIRKTASIPSKLYLRKLDRFMRGMTEIPLRKRQKYIRLVSKDQYNKDSVYILEMINRIEDIEKVDVLLKLFELRMTEVLTDGEFRRMSLMVASTMKEDLNYMVRHITNDSFEILTIQEEGLLLAGWLIYDGMSIGTSEKEGGNLYRYTALAKRFCKDVWNIECTNASLNGPVKFIPMETATEEDINRLFVENETLHIE